MYKSLLFGEKFARKRTAMGPFVSMTEPYSVLLDANSGEIFRISKNESWDAHLDHWGFNEITYCSSYSVCRINRKIALNFAVSVAGPEAKQSLLARQIFNP